jgi:hypothetical protein
VTSVGGEQAYFPLAGSKATELATALGYFEHNAHCTRYRHFGALGVFVGSGVVEAGCKTIVRQRLNLAGMRWSIAPPESCPCAAWTRPLGVNSHQARRASHRRLTDPATTHTTRPPTPGRLPAGHLYSCPTPKPPG